MAQTLSKKGGGIVGSGASRVRRGVLAATSLVAATFMALSSAAVPEAQAFIPASFEEATLGQEPVVSASLKHTPEKPKKGDKVTYTGEYSVQLKERGAASYDVKITITESARAPFSGGLTKDDLTVSSGTVFGPVKDGNDWVYTVKTTDITNFTASFSKEATVADDAPEASVVLATSTIKVAPTPPLSIGAETVENRLVHGADVCTGYSLHVAEVPVTKLGAWLADIKFAYDPSKVSLDELPDAATLFANGSDANARNSIKVENVSPEMLEKIKSGAVVKNNDTTPPLYAVDPKLKNLTFKDSINWKYDPAVWTGEAWLEPTAKVTLHRGYNYRSCFNNIATDGNIDRLAAMGVQYSLGRAAVDKTESAIDAFVLPGERKPIAWCEDLYYTDAAEGGNPITTSVGKVLVKNGKVVSSQNNIAAMTQSYGGIAISPKVKGWAYYIKDQTLRRVNLADARDEKVGTTGSYKPGLTSMAFDPDGRLWHMSPDGRLYYWENNEAGEPTGAAIKGAYIDRPTSYGGYTHRGFVQDIGFLANGDLVFGTNYDNGPKRANAVFTVGHASLKEGRTSVGQSNEWGLYPALDYAILGIAFAPTGELYASSGTNAKNTSKNLYLLPKGGKAVAVNYDGKDRPTKGFLGLTSCSFGPSDEQPPAPEGVQVQKVAYDPVTGAAAEPGGTTKNKITVNPDGTATVRYGVTVSNVGNNPKNPGDITDEFTAPVGFDVLEMSAVDAAKPKEKLAFSKENPVLQPGELAGLQVKSYIVTVKLKATSLAALTQVNGECNTEGAGTPGGGFFNKVAMTDDRDGDNNNDACIPIEVPKKAHIKLIKQIVDQDGKPYGDPEAQFPAGYDNAAELAKFNLTAAGFSVEDNKPISGATGVAQADGVAVDTDVLPGRYDLSEGFTGSMPEGSRQYFQAGEWSCEEGVLNEDGKSVTIPADGNAVCTVKNTFIDPRVHIEKVATNPTENPHVGEAVNLKEGETKDAPYTGELKYTIKVTNDSTVPVSSGVVTDSFTVPAGLQWQSGKDAKVEFISASGNATLLPADGKEPVKDAQSGNLVLSFTQDELAKGAVLAKSIQNLGPKGSGSDSVIFNIVIPVQEDNEVSGTDSTKFLDNQEKLGTCDEENLSDDSKVIGPDKSMGAVNVINLEDEYTGYTDVEGKGVKDNVACIPVKKEFPAEWKVKKLAKDEAQESGFTGAGDKSVGAKVTMTKLDDGSGYEAVATYKVVATNVGKTAASAPAISDTPTLPAGFSLTKVTYQALQGEDQEVKTVADAQSGVAFAIPAGSSKTKIDPKGTVEYIVTVTGQITKENAAQAKWDTTVGETLNDKKLGLGECEVTKNGTPGTGFFNFVTVDGDENEDEDNDSCVPVAPPASRVLIEKTDDTGVNRLVGAEFALFKADMVDGSFKLGEQLASPLPNLDEETAKEFTKEALAVKGAEGGVIEGADVYLGRAVTPELEIGQAYYLKETKSPAMDDNGAYSLLPEPLLFKVTGVGMVVPVNNIGDPLPAQDNIYNVSQSFFIKDGKVTVHDPRIGELPKAGGMGHWTLAGGAAVMIMISLFSLYRTGGRRRIA